MPTLLPGLQRSPHNWHQKAQSRTQSFHSTISFFLAIMLWLVFAPQQLGGKTSYIIVHGVSMEPLFYQGGLAVLREADYYQVGDIVTYNYPGLGQVIHRIVGRNGSHYILQGDANSWLDTYQPEKHEIIGKLWFYVPNLGNFLAQFRTPAGLALLVGIGMIMFGFSFHQPSDTKRRKRVQRRLEAAAVRIGYDFVHWQDSFTFVAYLIGLSGIALAIFAFTRPLTKTTLTDIAYEEVGLFAYSAVAPEGIYDDNRLKSGDVIFPAVNCSVDLFFNYHFLVSEAAQIEGNYMLTATLSDRFGWQRSIELQPKQTFQGNTFQVVGKLEICQVMEILRQVQEKTSSNNPPYFLSVSPHVEVRGSVNNIPFNDQFSPTLVFQIEPQKLYLADRPESGRNPLQPSQKGLVMENRIIDNDIPIMQVHLPVWAARWLGGAGMLVSISMLLLHAFIFRQAENKDDKLLVELLTRQKLINISTDRNFASSIQTDAICVDGLNALIQIANQLNVPILLYQTREEQFFVVSDAGTVYYAKRSVPSSLQAEEETV